MSPNEKNAAIGAMTHEQLLQLIAEMRKPVKTEKEIRDEEQLARDREQMGKMLQDARANKQREQESCAHMRRDGSTTVVWTGDPINKLYCQVCGAWIGADKPELFNRLYQLAI